MASTRNVKWDFEQPFEICLEEIWLHISRYLTDPHDLVNLSKSSSYIKDILLSAYPSLYFTEVFLYVAPYLRFNDVILCRKVCRRWNKEVVRYLDAFYDALSDLPQSFVADIDSEPGDVSIKGRVEIDRWENEMNTMQTNPVACRSFFMELVLGENTNEFVAGCLDHLSTWGCNIWTLKIKTPDINDRHMANSLTTIEYLEFVQSCLRYVPNLKTLHFYHDHYQEDEQEAQEWMAIHPFPPLPFLRHFDFYMFPYRRHFFAWEGVLTAYQSQVERLAVRSPECFLFLENENITLPRLTKLDLWVYSQQNSILLILRLAERSGWSLKSLDIYLIDTPTNEQRNAFQQLIQHSKSTLETFRIRMYVPDDPPDDYPPDETFLEGLTLPRLKLLQIASFDLQSLEFLIELCPNLKSLMITEEGGSNFVHLPRSRKPESKIACVYRRNEWDNVWNRIQSLESMDFSWGSDDAHWYRFHFSRNDFYLYSRNEQKS